MQSLHALWTGVQALHACGLTTLIRVPKYPYEGTSRTRTLIRVLCTLIAGLTSASRFERLTGLREPTGVQSLHACPKGVQALHAFQTGVQALHACLARLHACSPCARLL
ncbi:hypothetical protein PCANC_05613 [Puccinia coronata f. sp. avenae]|uniref:Uncharacterized protein n=1 Tax=Puccinia coronata f. sp. avenae TaxID=200324 RepID=A0A2N5VWZ3_9BASI|nr:hypothetical protein PCANC_05613 [Puccinia coronata f. sp. avenae]